MKILFLSSIAAIGGAERSMLSMVAMLRKHRPEIEIGVLALGEGPLLDALRDMGVTTISLAAPASVTRLGDSGIGAQGKVRLLFRSALALPGLWKLRRDFRRAVASFQPDLLHSNGIKMHLLSSWSNPSVPLVWHIQDFIGLRPVAGKLLKLASRRMTEAIAISQAVADDFLRVAGPKPVTLILHAVDISRFRPGIDGGGILDDTAVAPGTLRVGMVATYARWKGQDVFLDAAAKVLRTRPSLPVLFYVVGGPVYQTSGSQFTQHDLHNRTEKLGIAEKSRIVCFKSAIEEVYSSLDLVVHASTKPEPFGLTIVEAMACGRPVIASLAGGVGEIIENGVDAIGIPPGDSDAMASAILKLLQDEDLRRRLGANARSKAERLFDQERFGSQLGAVYERLAPTSRVC